MWAFQGSKAVYSPDEGKEEVVPSHHRYSSWNYIDPITPLSSSASPFDCHLPDAVNQTEQASRHDQQQRWSNSGSGSTLTEDNEPLPIPDLEKEGKDSTGPPKPVAFWDSALNSTRRHVFARYSWTLLVLCIFVLGVLSIYWGVLFQIKENLHSATIAVVDFDGSVAPYTDVEPDVGPFVVGATRDAAAQPHALGYITHSPAEYDYDPLAVRRAVHHEDIWGAIVINPNATALLRQAIEQGNSTYDPAGACHIIYNQARDVESYNQYIVPTLLRLGTHISNEFARTWTASVLANTSLSSTSYASTPQALSPGIAFTIYDLRPFDPPVAIPAVSIGLIYLIIIAFFSFSFFMPIHSNFLNPTTPTPHPPLKFTHLIIWRYIATMTAYLFLSLAYSLVSLAFQIPFSNHPPPGHPTFPTDNVAFNANLLGRGTFPTYYMLNFLGMGALGLPLEVAAMLLPNTQPWTSLFLIWWVITNVSTGFYALELAPGFYRWGYAWPLRQIVDASRALLFGTRSRLGLNFGVLVVWIVVATFAWVPSCYVLRKRVMKQKQVQAQSQMGNEKARGGASAAAGLGRSDSVKRAAREAARKPRVWVMNAFKTENA